MDVAAVPVVTVMVTIRVSVLNVTTESSETSSADIPTDVAASCTAEGFNSSWLYVDVSSSEARKVSTSPVTGPTSRDTLLTYFGGKALATRPAARATITVVTLRAIAHFTTLR